MLLLHGLPGEDLGEAGQGANHNHGQCERNADGDQLVHVREDTGVEADDTQFLRDGLTGIGQQKRTDDSEHEERVGTGILASLLVVGLSRGAFMKIAEWVQSESSFLSQSFSCQLSLLVGAVPLFLFRLFGHDRPPDG